MDTYMTIVAAWKYNEGLENGADIFDLNWFEPGSSIFWLS